MGKFVEQSLLSGEQVEVNAKISWWSQTGLLILAFIFLPGFYGIHLLFFSLLFLVIAFAVLRVITTELALTNKKLIGKVGIIRRDSVDLPINNVESLDIKQGILGRIFGFGTITVRGVGAGGVKIPYIKNPLEFRKSVMSSVDIFNKKATV